LGQEQDRTPDHGLGQEHDRTPDQVELLISTV
jgi:hypothetical protein